MSSEYKIDGNRIIWDGPEHQSWHEVANRLTTEQCIAVIIASKMHPFPMGSGADYLADALKAASYSVATNGGRQLSFTPRHEPDSKLELYAHNILNSADQDAYKLHASRIATLRYYLCRRAHDGCNAPTDSYMRLAAGTLKGY